MTNPNILKIGQTIKIPAKTGTIVPQPVPTTINYTVKAGDTLYSIAKRYGVTVQSIVTANKLASANVIRVGQVLKIPASTGTIVPKPVPTTINYTVKAGDTLYSIAKRYGVTVQSIVTANKLASANVIRVGQVLKIPASTGTIVPKPVPTTINYTVKAGDTLYSIAKRYGVTVQSVVTINKLASANVIKIGQVLKIPTV